MIFRGHGKVGDDFAEMAGQMMHGFFDDFFRDATIICFSDATRDAGLCVAVATQRNSQTDDGLIVFAIHESHDGFRDAALTRTIETVVWADFFNRVTKVVVVARYIISCSTNNSLNKMNHNIGGH